MQPTLSRIAIHISMMISLYPPFLKNLGQTIKPEFNQLALHISIKAVLKSQAVGSTIHSHMSICSRPSCRSRSFDIIPSAIIVRSRPGYTMLKLMCIHPSSRDFFAPSRKRERMKCATCAHARNHVAECQIFMIHTRDFIIWSFMCLCRHVCRRGL